MHKKITQFSLTLACITLMTTGAMAFGLGGYGAFDYSWGSASIKHKSYSGSGANGSINNMIPGGGITFDTNLLGPSIFNYRLKIGGDKFYNDGESSFEGHGAHFFNSFGFKVYGTDKIRLWLGPGFGFRYIKGNSKSGLEFGKENTGFLEEYWSIIAYDPNDPSQWIGNIGLHSSREVYTLYGFEAGLVFGMNFAISNVVVISAEVMAKYYLMWGERTRSVTTWISLTESIPGYTDYRSGKDKIMSHCIAGNVTLGILFRFGEDMI